MWRINEQQPVSGCLVTDLTYYGIVINTCTIWYNIKKSPLLLIHLLYTVARQCKIQVAVLMRAVEIRKKYISTVYQQ